MKLTILPILVLVLISRALSCSLTSKYNIYIVDELPPNTPSLFMHCHSQDDNLGSHKLNPGQDFNFGFCESATGSRFTCELWWNGKDKSFDVFSSDWSDGPCDKSNVCYWAVKEDGIYFSAFNPPRRLEKAYSW